MDALSLSPLSPANLSALTALRPVPPLPVQDGKTTGSSALAIQDLAQGLFQRALQASIHSPVSESGGGNVGLGQEATASLLASLAAPQAPASATAPTDATTNAITQAAPSTAPSATPPAAVLADAPVTQDAFASSSTLDFALQAALRFGAGVAGQGTPALATADLSTGLIRDAATVQRLGNLQAQAGAPGPEAFTLPQATTSRVLRSYEAAPIPAISAEASRVDVFA
ncbi:MAG: hypothetical protein HXX12_11645 [Geothrix sp.]|uniref:hypothetical protein n=1 Tax=Geothrix sp. TaxID=1962974 RepID=UPI0018310D63|nr:hypothetical protein [Geothrix sp.]NWJ41612.1 hypothetical protein [Geothrix sp.]WIL20406.1 MAG: hypothetical protein QOZ81_002975 [Geothrix sp.]